jgi:hypothetical protein
MNPLKSRTKKNWVRGLAPSPRQLLACVLVLAVATSGVKTYALVVVNPPGTNFYVDADWTGAQIGTAAQPWTNLNGSIWNNTIAIALSNQPVTIYFNSREQGTNLAIDMTYAPNTAFGTYRLTFDGSSFYNASETSPTWVAETAPTNLANIQSINSENSSHLKYSTVTIHGLHISSPGSFAQGKAITIAGDNWIIENCNVTVQPGAVSGPTILLVSTADGPHDGGVAYTVPCTNIVLRWNTIHDTFADAIYLGGGAALTNPAAPDPGSGYPSHAYVWVQSNTMYNLGTRSTTNTGQANGINIKGGIYYLTVESNDISGIFDPANLGCRPIVMQGQTNGASQVRIIRNNFIHDCAQVSDAAISVCDQWGVPEGMQIYNNVICNIAGIKSHQPTGIFVYGAQDPVKIFNNTIYNCESYGLYTEYTNAPIQASNNLIWGNNLTIPEQNGGQKQVCFKGGDSVASDYNAYAGTWGYSGEGSHSIVLTLNQISNSLVNIAAENFQIVAGAPIIGMGIPLSGIVSMDITGSLIIGTSWNMGAYNFNPQTPLPPSNLHLVAQ